ncbi:HzsA-related protein [Pontiella sulfatireligans]|uniref:Hydrazine synthase alpha subunit middle domain-containing protein n=1 Tax=Pontiella sulfatireligans TaxID=2750658 RepID=A0A6C2UIH4_9BACT|nr:hypothetical protein [Pontiella sulfatireligans]VGO19673.1 hypothetical protein SCARR_01732 [Pontiella sulfatireligans]
MKCIRLITAAVLALALGQTIADPVRTAQLQDFDVISHNIEKYHPSHWAEYAKVSSQAWRQEALILETDRTPVDVILRRTQALINHLGAERHQRALDALKKRNKTGLAEEEQRKLFVAVAQLRRKVAFSNPLLDFDSLIFLKHDPMARGDAHMVDQYLGVNQTAGGGVFRLDKPFTSAPKTTSLLEGGKLDLGNGSFISLELDYDAQEILFAYTGLDWKNFQGSEKWKGQPWTQEEAAGQKGRNSHYCFQKESSFHIFKANANGKNLQQLTDGQWDDFDPVFLPSGRIVFISARAGGNQRCGWRFIPTYTLFGMMPDGSDIQQFSWHDTNEWHPSVNHDGMLVYTRWDYVDRDSDIAHHLWFCYPDGRDPRSMHGNYPDDRSSRPWMEMSIRAVPGSQKYIAVAAPHHGEAYGSLALIDQSIPDDRAMSQIKRITPLSAFPESEVSPGLSFRKGKGDKQRDWNYGTPWPLDEDFYLCVYSDKKRGNYGIYLIDSFGNRELVYRDPSISCLDPIPLRARPRPPQFPVQTQQMAADRESSLDPATATISVMNVYESEFPIPEGVKIKEMRIVNIFPKSTHSINNPRIGYADQSIARGVLGTVPVEEDGSVFFECPTGTGIYFQLLDGNGMMVQNMRTDTYLHPGEKMNCIGCHENKLTAPKINRIPMALKHPPSKIKPEAPGTYPLSFPRLVQPVLDKHPEFFEALYPDQSLSGTEFGKWGWSEAMHTLSKDAWGKHGGNGALRKKNKRSYSLPMQEGARVSKLWKKLEAAGARQMLPPEDLRRITLWLDCNSNFYGAYKQIEEQAQAGIILPEEGLPEWSDPKQFIN